jgi:tetratricopeptide (TPR) repeat protein
MADSIDSLLQEAQLLQRQGSLPEAIARYSDILRREPAHTGALYYLAAARCQQGDLERGADLCRRIIAADARHARAHNLLGKVLLLSGRAGEALQSFDAALASAPDLGDAHLQRANLLLQSGRLQEALAGYDRALTLVPDSASGWANRGEVLYRLERDEEALASLDHAVALQPRDAQARHNRGNVLLRLRRFAEALVSYDEALALAPDLVTTLLGRATALKALGRHDEALASVEQALRRDAGAAEALAARAGILHALGRTADAIECYRAALTRDPALVEAHQNLANALLAADHPDEAIVHYQQALSLRPDFVEAHVNLSSALTAVKRYDDALGHGRAALALKPDSVHAHVSLGAVLHGLNRDAEAVAHCERALALEPDLAAAHQNLGNALQGLWRLDDALAHHHRAIALSPGYAEAHCSLARALELLDRPDEAVSHYDRAIELNPALAIAKWNKSLLCLSQGRLREGWEHFEERWRVLKPYPRFYAQPRWSGGRVDGTLLVCGDQGIGDQMLHAGALTDVVGCADRVVLEVEPRLVALFARSFPAINVVPRGEQPYAGHFAKHTALSCLTPVFRADWSMFPNRSGGHLVADPVRSEELRRRLHLRGQQVIGISWISHNPETGRSKTAALADFAALLRIPGCRFIDLQYGDTARERERLACEHGLAVERLDDVDTTDDIDGLAALMMACDAIVTVSNSTAHLAGALGRPAWVMVPRHNRHLWYWHKHRPDSPWYPSVRMRHQPRAYEWSSLVASVAKEVAAWLEGGEGGK